MEYPLVSVVVPAYNRADYLGDALRSALRQDYRPIEIIVVDDGSTDRTAVVARSFEEVAYIHQTNQGVAAARNAGITAARGEFIAFLDSDDVWLPNKLSRQIAFHLENPPIACSVTHLRNTLEPDCPPPAWLRPELLAEDHPGMTTAALAVRRDVFKRVGLFDLSYRVGEDSEWFFRAKDAGVAVAVIPEMLLYRRIHRDNLSGQASLVKANLVRMVKSAFDRKRAAVGTGGRSS